MKPEPQELLALAQDWRTRAATIRERYKDAEPVMAAASARASDAFEICASELEQAVGAVALGLLVCKGCHLWE